MKLSKCSKFRIFVLDNFFHNFCASLALFAYSMGPAHDILKKNTKYYVVRGSYR